MPRQGVEEKKSIKTNHKQTVSKKGTVGFVIDSETKNSDENNFSVITKTTKPKIVIQSENIENPCTGQSKMYFKHKIVKFAFLIVISSIVLITFFLSIKTYNMVSELHQLLFN